MEKPGAGAGKNKVSIVYDSRRLRLISSSGGLYPMNNSKGELASLDT